jgi:hypothetical protein
MNEPRQGRQNEQEGADNHSEKQAHHVYPIVENQMFTQLPEDEESVIYQTTRSIDMTRTIHPQKKGSAGASDAKG